MNQLLTQEFLEKQYLKLRKSTREIANEINLNHNVIYYWVKKYGINRNHKESSKFGEEHPNWKGNDLGYFGIHARIKTQKSKPLCCEKCKEKKNLELANISGMYKIDINDYKWLCKSCHTVMDWESGQRTIENYQNLRKIGDKLKCSSCKLILDYHFFGENKRNIDGKQSYCKKCIHKKYVESKQNGY